MVAFLADCRARLAFDLMANTWNPVLVWALRDGPLRPAELRRLIGGIRSKVLTEALRRLERAGLVERRVGRDRVEYALTPLGTTMLPAIDAMGRWAVEHGAEVGID